MRALATDHFGKGTLVEAVQAFYTAADKTVDKELFFLMNLPRKKGGGLFISAVTNGARTISVFVKVLLCFRFSA